MNMGAPCHRSSNNEASHRINWPLQIVGTGSAYAGDAGYIRLEADGQSAILDRVHVWGHVLRLLKTVGRSPGLEDGSAATHQALLLVGPT
jgi:hypothetical protein